MNETTTDHILAFFLVSAMALYAFKRKALNGPGSITGFIVALCIYAGGRWAGLSLLFVFFISGTFVSKWKRAEKTQLGISTENGVTRKTANVLGNGLVPAILGLLAFFYPPYQQLFSVMLAGSLAAATSDTFSSELGNIYGKKFYDILSFHPGTRGRDGVVSMEGSLWGLAGALLIAAIFTFYERLPLALMVFFAGMAGNLTDSLLGATLQRQNIINNHQVNFMATLAAAVIAGCLFNFLR